MTRNRRHGNIFRLALCLLSAMLATTALADEDKDRYLRLNIGTPELKDKILSVSPNNLYEMSAGQPIEFSRMIDSMMTSRFIYVGETHNSLPMHDIQLKVIQAMYKKDRRLAIGLEMIPITLQHVLDKWSLGILTEEEFIQDTVWYETWNFNYKFYEKIFDFAKLNKIPLYGLNIPKVLITKIRMKGWDALTDDEKKIVPQPDVSNEEHRTLIRTIFESSELPHEMKGPGLGMMFEGLYRAQSAWDESMAYYASRASDLSERRIIVLAGSGHLLFNLGISRRAYERNGSPFKTVICLEIPQEKATLRVSQSLADYVWALNEEVHPIFPSIGLSFKKFEGLKNLVIEREPIDGVAKGGNFAKGDIILSVDDKTFTEINALRNYLSKFRWKDKAKFRLVRDAKEHEVVLEFLPQDDKDLKE